MIIATPELVTEFGQRAVYPAFYLKIGASKAGGDEVPYIFGSGVITAQTPLTFGSGFFFGAQPNGRPDVGVIYKFGASSTFVTNAVKRLFIPDGVGATATPEQGESSWSGFLAEIQDCPEIRKAVADFDPLKNRVVSVFAGTSDLPTSKWVQVGAGTIDLVKQTQNSLAFQISVVDFARWPKTAVFNLLQCKLKNTLSASTTTSADVYPIAADNPNDFGLFPTTSGTVSPTVPFSIHVRIDDEVLSWTAATNLLIGGATPGQLLRGQFGTVAAAHSDGATITEVLRLYGHPIDLDLYVKTSTGTAGANGLYDVLPARHGIGMPQERLLISGASEKSFQSVKAAMIQEDLSSAFDFLIIEPESDAKRWAALELYKPNNCFPLTQGDGRMGLSLFKPPEPSQDFQVIGPEIIILGSAKFSQNDQLQFNQINWFFDWDPIKKKFGSFPTIKNAASITKYGKVFPLTIESKGMRSRSLDGTTVMPGTATALVNGERALARFALPPPRIQCETTLPGFINEMGDLVLFSSNFCIDTRVKSTLGDGSPNPQFGLMGIGPVCVQIVEKKMNWKRGTMSFVLSFAFADARYGLIAENGEVNYPSQVGALAGHQTTYVSLSDYPGAPGSEDLTAAPTLSSDGGTGNGVTSFRWS